MPREAVDIRKMIEPSITGLGYELVGVEFARARHGLLRIYIDHENGISVSDCQKVSYQVSGVLDVEDPIAGRYSLEVSSPGLDRPLFQPRDFERFAGSNVRVKLGVPLNGQRKFVGVLVGLKDNELILDTEDGEIKVPLNNVDLARLIPDYATPRAESVK